MDVLIYVLAILIINTDQQNTKMNVLHTNILFIFNQLCVGTVIINTQTMEQMKVKVVEIWLCYNNGMIIAFVLDIHT